MLPPPADWLQRQQSSEITTPSFRLVQTTSESAAAAHSNSNGIHPPPHSKSAVASSVASDLTLVASSTSPPLNASTSSFVPSAALTSPVSTPLTSKRSGRIIKLKLRADEDGAPAWSAASPSPDGSAASFFQTVPPLTPAKRTRSEHPASSLTSNHSHSHLPPPPPSIPTPSFSAAVASSSSLEEDAEEEDLSDLGMTLRHSRALHQLKREYVLNTLKRHKLKRSVSTPRTPSLASTSQTKTPRVSHARGAMKLIRESSLNALSSSAAASSSSSTLAATGIPASPSVMSPMPSPMSSKDMSMDWSTAAAASTSSSQPPALSRQVSLEPFSLTPVPRTNSQTQGSQSHTQPIDDDTTMQTSDQIERKQESSSVPISIATKEKEEYKESLSSCAAPSPLPSTEGEIANISDVSQSVHPMPTIWSVQSAGIDPASMYYLKAWQPTPTLAATTEASFSQPKFNYDPTARPWRLPKKYILCMTPPLDQHARQLSALSSSNPNANIITLPAAAFFKEASHAPTSTMETRHSHREHHSGSNASEESPNPSKKKKLISSASSASLRSSTPSSLSGAKQTPVVSGNSSSMRSSSSRAQAALDAELQEKTKLLAYLQVRSQYLKVQLAAAPPPIVDILTVAAPPTTIITTAPATTSTATAATAIAPPLTPHLTSKPPTPAPTPTAAATKPETRKYQTRVKKEPTSGASVAASTMPFSSGTSSASTPRTPRSQAGTPRVGAHLASTSVTTAASPMNASVVKAESVRADTPPSSAMLLPSAAVGTMSGMSSPFSALSSLPITSGSMILGSGGGGNTNTASGSTATAGVPSMADMSLFPLGMPFSSYDLSQFTNSMDLNTMMQFMAQAQLHSLMAPALYGLGYPSQQNPFNFALPNMTSSTSTTHTSTPTASTISTPSSHTQSIQANPTPPTTTTTNTSSSTTATTATVSSSKV